MNGEGRKSRSADEKVFLTTIQKKEREKEQQWQSENDGFVIWSLHNTRHSSTVCVLGREGCLTTFWGYFHTSERNKVMSTYFYYSV